MKNGKLIGVIIGGILFAGAVKGVSGSDFQRPDEPTNTNTATTPPVARTSTAQQKAVDFGKCSNQFGVALLSELRRADKNGNIVVSPVSISVALCMLLNGADARTLTQTAAILGVNENDLANLNKSVSDFLDNAIQADPDVELEIANAIFAAKGNKIDAQFMRTMQREFQARVKELDFNADPQAATTKINEWVSQKTNGKIPDLFGSLPGDTVMVLANAVYFKAAWQMPFEQSKTTQRSFAIPGGDRLAVATMHQQRQFAYLETADFQAVSLEYGDNARFSMDVYLPKTNVSLDVLVSKLSAAALVKNGANFAYRAGELYLPKMKISWSQPLNDALQTLGMKDAFNEALANFSKLFTDKNKKLAVDVVQHKTFLEVNETGTEAAAATGIGIVATTSVDQTVPFLMDVNRPFVFVIRDSQSGAILFMGIICDPTK